MSSAYLFPGQGAQYVGMGETLAERYEEAGDVFKEADRILNEPLSQVMFKGPEEKLRKTDICQPAIFVHSMAALAIIQKRLPNLEVNLVMGLSLGEYTALTHAGVLRFEDALRLVKRRGQLMQEASDQHPGGLVSIVGLDLASAERLCQESGAVIANLNSPDQIVVAGDQASLKKLETLSSAAGVRRLIPINVAGAFHSPLMNDAAEGLYKSLQKITFHKPHISVLSNLTGKEQTHPNEIRSNLRNQVNHLTRWRDCCELAAKMAITEFTEIGPGKVLRGLMRKNQRGATVLNIDTADDMDKYLTAMASCGARQA